MCDDLLILPFITASSLTSHSAYLMERQGHAVNSCLSHRHNLSSSSLLLLFLLISSQPPSKASTCFDVMENNGRMDGSGYVTLEGVLREIGVGKKLVVASRK